MEETVTSSPYKQMNLRDQIYREARAMAEYALANGKEVPEFAIKAVENFASNENGNNEDCSVKSDLDISDLVAAHSILVKLVDPAKPKTILLLDMEHKAEGFLKFLGPVSLIRQMMIAALLSLLLFLSLAMTEAVSAHGGSIMSQHGIWLLLNLLFYLAAAGLGASFAGLYKANYYITSGTFDPTYHASYWIRFFLGLIAGLILAIMISEEYFTKAAGTETAFLAPGIVRPMMAMMGGFSAGLTYTLLSRLVETFQSLFMGSPENQMKQMKMEKHVELELNKNHQQMITVTSLINIQQAMANGATPNEINKKISHMIKETLPGKEIFIEYKDEEIGSNTKKVTTDPL